MNCSEVQELLSEYLDGELADDRRSRVSAHIDECLDCAKDIDGFEKLSTMASALTPPVPPERIWEQLEQQLNHQPLDEQLAGRSVGEHRYWSLSASKRFAFAAVVLVAAGFGWFTYHSWFAHGQHDQFTADFGQYLDEFHRDSGAAQQILLAKYENQLVNPDHAIERVGYRPATADGLPDGYSMESTYVIKMPCCTCVQCLCKRTDGSTISIFEHDDEETQEWFGDRPEMSTNCGGKPCSLVQLNDRIAASWKRVNRHITVVGVRDVAELNELVAWFDERKQARLPE